MSWEQAMHDFEAMPEMVYAGSEPTYITNAKLRGWARLEKLAAEGDQDAIDRIAKRDKEAQDAEHLEDLSREEPWQL